MTADRPRWLFALVLAAGCAPRAYPLSEVPVTGASGELEALTRVLLPAALRPRP